MVNLVKRLLGKSKEPKWSDQIGELKRQFEDINSVIQKSMNNKSVRVKLKVLDKMIIDMPEWIQKFEGSVPKDERGERSFYYFVDGLNLCLTACQHYKQSLLENSEVAKYQAIRHMQRAIQLIEQS